MKTLKMVIFFFLLALMISCGGEKGGDKENADETVGESKASPLKTFTFNWSAICRCQGETTAHGKLCSQNGTYTGQHESEEEAVAMMKEETRELMECTEGPFLSFRYEIP
ncbi:MAG: hypothetical protein JRG97_09025 [Deltaproteobacteria bacterium]|nr:hypothetical protein [Deltaproteobacteria bacterium]MBW2052706.1 hypothetical protein [Deltaproteobacteria bacterium]MBW2141200.1 hypothetical protein [Deltaproteobacteria bacterium]MBW2323062.1 hypothetical protein [Deltaproteobacteria bacterium]